MKLRDSQASLLTLISPSPFFWSGVTSTWSYLGTSEDHNTGVCLCRRVNRNRYLYFFHPPSIQLLSLHHGICRGSYLLLLETTATVSVFSLFHTLSPLLHFHCPLPPLFALSHYQGIILSAKAYTHGYPLCSPLSLCSSFTSSFSNLFSSITHFNKKGIRASPAFTVQFQPGWTLWLIQKYTKCKYST